jgi:gliding motility-associated protein GldE
MDEYLQQSQTLFYVNSINFNQVVLLLITIVLLGFSALISGSEIAFFSVTPKEKADLSKNTLTKRLLSAPEQLLSTILIANNFVNIGIIIITTYLVDNVFVFSSSILSFIVKVIFISFLILLFGEILPKTYAIRYPKSLIRLMSPVYIVLNYIFSPINFILIKSSNYFKNKFEKHNSNITVGDISEVIEMTTSDLDKTEKQLLEGIVNFQDTEVKSIMHSRVNMITVDIREKFENVLKLINESGFSRIPVINESPDNIEGILYIKDLLPYVSKNTFKWQTIIRSAYFVPESKKIDSLLRDFQIKKTHIAIVIDEYGGTSGLITLEDILEEIIGDIQDEHDEQEEKLYKKEKSNIYNFKAEINLIDFLNVIDKDKRYLDDYKGDADSLGGLMLELKGELPQKDEIIKIKDIEFIIIEVDNRRIKQIKTLIGNA